MKLDQRRRPERPPKELEAKRPKAILPRGASRYARWLVVTIPAENDDLETRWLLQAAESRANRRRWPFDSGLKQARGKFNEALSMLHQIIPDPLDNDALCDVIDAAFNLGVRATLSPVTKEYFHSKIQSEIGKKSVEARAAKDQRWIPRASEHIKALWPTPLSEEKIAWEVSLKMCEETGEEIKAKRLLRLIQSMKVSGELKPRPRGKQPASRRNSA